MTLSVVDSTNNRSLAANFTAYTALKAQLQKWQPQYPEGGLPTWQTGLIGLISGALGPFTNAPVRILIGIDKSKKN